MSADSGSRLETQPWTVAAFQEARRRTWRAIRVWLLTLAIGLIGFTVPFLFNQQHVIEKRPGRFVLSLDDMPLWQIKLSFGTFILIGTSILGIIRGVERHYRCPKCHQRPTGGWGWVSVCPTCRALLSPQ